MEMNFFHKHLRYKSFCIKTIIMLFFLSLCFCAASVYAQQQQATVNFEVNLTDLKQSMKESKNSVIVLTTKNMLAPNEKPKRLEICFGCEANEKVRIESGKTYPMSQHIEKLLKYYSVIHRH